MSVLVPSISSTQAVSRSTATTRIADLCGLGVLCFFAFTFPLANSATRMQSNAAKYYLLAAVAMVLCWVLWSELRRQGSLGLQVRQLRPGLLVGAVLTGYSFLLCGVSMEILLMAVTAPVLMLVFQFRLGQEEPARRTILWLVAGFSLLAVAACFFSLHQYTALTGHPYRRTGLSTFFACLLVFFGAFLLLRDRAQGMIALKLLLVSGFVASGVALVQFFMPRDLMVMVFPPLLDDPRPYGTLGHTNWFGTYLLLLLPFAIHFLFKERRWRWALLVGLLHGSLLICQTRGAWLAEGMLILLVAVIWRHDWKRLAELFAILVLVTAILLPAQDWKILKRASSLKTEAELAASGSSSAGTGRFAFWKYGLKYLPQYAVLGAGLDSFEEMAKEGEKAPISKAHSIYLDHALSVGIVGLALYLCFLWKCFWSHAPPGLGWAFRGMLVAYLIQGFFIHDTIQTWPLLWLLAGLSLGPLARRAMNKPVGARAIVRVYQPACGK